MDKPVIETSMDDRGVEETEKEEIYIDFGQAKELLDEEGREAIFLLSEGGIEWVENLREKVVEKLPELYENGLIEMDKKEDGTKVSCDWNRIVLEL